MKCRWAIPCLLVFLALISSSSAQTSALEDGVRLIREGRFHEARIKLEQAQQIAPSNASIENLLGIVETQLGHIDKAGTHYRNSIRLDPSQAAPHRNLGFNLLNSKSYAAAEPELRMAARLDPKDKFAHFYLMSLALATGRDSDAVEESFHAGEIVNGNPDAAAELIGAEVRVGQVAEASRRIELLEKNNQISPAQEYAIAVLLSRHAAYAEAVHCFRQIVALNPSWESRYNLALALLYNGQSKDASALLVTLHAERPASADVLMFLGSSYEMQQKMPEALDAYRAAAAAEPANPDRTLDYTRLLMDLDRYDEAIEIVHAGMEQTNATAPLELRLGAVEMLKSNYASARKAFQAALAIDPALDVAYVGLAQTYAREANDAEAIRILEAARAKFPGHYPLEYYFGLLASRLGREQEGIAALRKATEIEPNSPDPFYELGKLYAAREDWPNARQALEQVVDLNPQLAPAHYQLSRVYAHLGLNSKSEQEAKYTHMLIDEQRNEALSRQRERAGSFQPQDTATSPSQP